MGVGGVGIKQKCSGRSMGFVPRERKRPQIIKTNFSLEIHKRGGGGGGNSPWRAQHLGEITWIKDVDE
jgi:hypothetical protein